MYNKLIWAVCFGLSFNAVFTFIIYLKQFKFMATQLEMAEKLSTVAVTVAKIGTETKTTLDLVASLKEQLANQDNVTPELQSAFDALEAQVKVVDDLVPDAPPADEPPTT